MRHHSHHNPCYSPEWPPGAPPCGRGCPLGPDGGTRQSCTKSDLRATPSPISGTHGATEAPTSSTPREASHRRAPWAATTRPSSDTAGIRDAAPQPTAYTTTEATATTIATTTTSAHLKAPTRHPDRCGFPAHQICRPASTTPFPPARPVHLPAERPPLRRKSQSLGQLPMRPHVSAHTSQLWNELADTLATDGRSQTSPFLHHLLRTRPSFAHGRTPLQRSWIDLNLNAWATALMQSDAYPPFNSTTQGRAPPSRRQKPPEHPTHAHPRPPSPDTRSQLRGPALLLQRPDDGRSEARLDVARNISHKFTILDHGLDSASIVASAIHCPRLNANTPCITKHYEALAVASVAKCSRYRKDGFLQDFLLQDVWPLALHCHC